MKGANTMKCEHKRIKSVNCMLSCMDCGEVLPECFLSAKKQAKNPDQGAKAGKTTTGKKTAKKAE